MAAYAAAKARLFSVPTLKSAIINSDDAHAVTMISELPPGCSLFTYGLQDHALVRAFNVRMGLSGSTFEVNSPWGLHAIKTRTLGLFNVYNSLAVFTSLMNQGYPADAVVSLMATLTASPGRMELISEKPCVMVDYAHTPDALENALMTLAPLKKGQLWVVFGCGGDRDRTKRPMMGSVVGRYADRIVLTSDNPRSEDPLAIIADIAVGIPSSTS